MSGCFLLLLRSKVKGEEGYQLWEYVSTGRFIFLAFKILCCRWTQLSRAVAVTSIKKKKKKQSPASLFGVNIGFIHHVRCTHSVTPPWPYTYIYIINNNNSNNGHLKCVLLRPPLLAWLHDRADSIFPSFLHSKFLIQKKTLQTIQPTPYLAIWTLLYV